MRVARRPESQAPSAVYGANLEKFATTQVRERRSRNEAALEVEPVIRRYILEKENSHEGPSGSSGMKARSGEVDVGETKPKNTLLPRKIERGQVCKCTFDELS